MEQSSGEVADVIREINKQEIMYVSYDRTGQSDVRTWEAKIQNIGPCLDISRFSSDL